VDAAPRGGAGLWGFSVFFLSVNTVWTCGRLAGPNRSARLGFSVFNGLTAVAKDEKPSFEPMVRSTTHTRILQNPSVYKYVRCFSFIKQIFLDIF
jgi:hypothetical protein